VRTAVSLAKLDVSLNLADRANTTIANIIIDTALTHCAETAKETKAKSSKYTGFQFTEHVVAFGVLSSISSGKLSETFVYHR
jgi:hypothetical protein